MQLWSKLLQKVNSDLGRVLSTWTVLTQTVIRLLNSHTNIYHNVGWN
jgi:hypothetical protein